MERLPDSAGNAVFVTGITLLANQFLAQGNHSTFSFRR
jgi:hypothetical protein